MLDKLLEQLNRLPRDKAAKAQELDRIQEEAVRAITDNRKSMRDTFTAIPIPQQRVHG